MKILQIHKSNSGFHSFNYGETSFEIMGINVWFLDINNELWKSIIICAHKSIINLLYSYHIIDLHDSIMVLQKSIRDLY